jgi:hypothetical protein
MPVAVAVHGDDPAAPVWALTTDPFRRRALHQLPADPGPAGYPDPTADDEDDGFDEDDPLDDDEL